MYFVYILKSQKDVFKHYVGVTNDVTKRLKEHNEKPSCSHTIKYRPWDLVSFISFDKHNKAIEFESYLKSHSGRAFLKKHFL